MSEITFQAAQDEVMSNFATYWAGRTYIQSPNRPSVRSKIDPTEGYIEWLMTGAAGGQTQASHSVDRNHFQRDGTLTFTANAPKNDKGGTDLATNLLEAALHFIEAWKLPNVRFRNLGTFVPLGDDGTYAQVSVSADWFYFTDRASALN